MVSPHEARISRLASRRVPAAAALVAVSIALAFAAAHPAPALAEAAFVTEGGLAFRAETFAANDVPLRVKPFFYPSPAPISGEATGVVMRIVDGVPHDMALRQAEWGYRYLGSYRSTGDDWYLQRAKAQADHLIAVHATDRDAWFFPSTFLYRLDSKYGGGTLNPPWYSGIAQGAAVGFFARLWETTGDPVYRDAAEHTFESFRTPRQDGRLWLSNVDEAGYLHFEQYPGSRWELIYNGHMEAVLGLYDYYRVTGDTRALALCRGGLTTVLAYGEVLRNPGWVSAYALGARAPYVSYHKFSGAQLLQFYAITGDGRFARLANAFDDDFPISTTSGKVTVMPGSYTAYRFDSAGVRVATAGIRATTEKSYYFAERVRVKGRAGAWFLLQGGALDGYCVQEVPGRVFYRGAIDVLEYAPALPVRLRVGRWTMVRLGGSGAVPGSRVARIGESTTEQAVGLRNQLGTAEKRAVVDGVPRVLMASGPFAGYWVPRSAVRFP